jgi:hypothetical protein
MHLVCVSREKNLGVLMLLSILLLEFHEVLAFLVVYKILKREK